MNNKKLISILAVMGIVLTGCGSDTGRRTTVNNGNTVDKVLQEGINEENKAKEEQNGEKEEQGEQVTPTNNPDEQNEQVTPTNTPEESGENTSAQQAPGNYTNSPDRPVDIDLTEMGSNMVYATVYQLVSEPEEYVGKKISIKGTYSVTWYEGTGKYYHYAFIQDAAACCQQGMEFVWGDGNHVYPDDYPEQNQDIIVTGIFELYEEEGFEYMRLSDATLEVL